jgi:alkaline phosphatase
MAFHIENLQLRFHTETIGMSDKFGRRAFLGRSGALATLAGGLERLNAAQLRGEKPANIIWMVSDGMSPGVLPLAEQFSIRARGRGTVWQALHGGPGVAHAMMDMASLDSLVTDSSSASSSWGSGSRIFNAWVNMLPDGTRLVPIAELARDKGKRVGLVTTATVTHATPAGFAAVSRRRDDEASIARQYLKVADVILGGGARFFNAPTRPDKCDLPEEFRRAGFKVVRKRAELLESDGPRLLGLFGESHLPYTLDHRNDEALSTRVPALAEMTEAALRSLANSPKGFLLQVEGARIDHAAHNTDPAAMVWDQIAFDDAIGVVLRFAEKHPGTLVVITSDHGNANPGLNGTGTEYRDSDMVFERLLSVRTSFQALTPRFGVRTEYTMKPDGALVSEKPSAARVKDATREAFGFDLASQEVEWVRSAAAGFRGVAISRQYDKLVGVLGQVLSNHTGIGWTGTSHTSDYTVVTALGPGAQRFNGFVRNTDVFPILCEFMEVTHRNPVMAPERALGFRNTAAVRSAKPHWV